jgi:hypothetical protein
MEMDSGLIDQRRFQERMLERFLTQPKAASREDTDYLLEKLDQVKSEARSSGRDAPAPAESLALEPEWASMA